MVRVSTGPVSSLGARLVRLREVGSSRNLTARQFTGRGGATSGSYPHGASTPTAARRDVGRQVAMSPSTNSVPITIMLEPA